jgi:hypothetical protein
MSSASRPSRGSRIIVTPEMLHLFKRGQQLMAEGRDDVGDDSAEADEFRAIGKRLNITLLRKGWHEVSVLDPMLDGPMPDYMERLASGRDWHISVSQRQALLQAVELEQERMPSCPKPRKASRSPGRAAALSSAGDKKSDG